jgi:hypothetical protein
MGDIILAVKETPVPGILVAGGILFLFVAVGGQFGAKVASDKVKREYAAVIGVGLLFGGIALYAAGSVESFGTPTDTAGVSPDAATATAIPPSVAPSPTSTPEPSLTPTPAPVESISGPEPQEVRWGPVDGREAGICIDGCDEFVPWATLEGELRQKLLPQVSGIPAGSQVRVEDFQGKRDWVRLVWVEPA